MKKLSNVKKVLLLGVAVVSIISMNPIKANAEWSRLGDSYKYVYLNNDGSRKMGWLQEGSDWYYLDPSDKGIMVSNEVKNIDGQDYAFDVYGKLFDTNVYWKSNTEAVINGVEYTDIVKYNDYKKEVGGETNFPNNYYMCRVKGTGEKQYERPTYNSFLIVNNKVLIGKKVQNIDGKTYRTNPDGSLITGWFNDYREHTWNYYDEKNGELKIGKFDVNGRSYNVTGKGLFTYDYILDSEPYIDQYGAESYRDYLAENPDAEFYAQAGLSAATLW